jgi:hypothetical protein
MVWSIRVPIVYDKLSYISLITTKDQEAKLKRSTLPTKAKLSRSTIKFTLINIKYYLKSIATQYIWTLRKL